MTAPSSMARRCAIYTRKSSAAPFGQSITSLETQRTICTAYITSQGHKAWTPVEHLYDDDAQSGSTLDRPALRRLLQDVEAGFVDVVLVYKMDRITRSLTDFIRLMDFFERHGVAFVSITQNFDSSDSLGRLVRNVLLVFAEFEREISRDRVRDKRLYVKRTGRWTAGRAPMGYVLEKGKLVVDDDEADTVRRIFELYLDVQRPQKIPAILEVEGRRSAVRHMINGRVRGGGVPTAGAIYKILENPVYVGDIGRGDQRVRGIHKAIIDWSVWEQAQALLDRRRNGRNAAPEHSLQGLIRDAYGRAMYPVRAYNTRGYISSSVKADRPRTQRLKIKADAIEGVVTSAIRNLLEDRAKLRPVLLGGGAASAELDVLSRAGAAAARRLAALPVDEAKRTHNLLIMRVEAAFDCVRVILNLRTLTAYLRWNGIGVFRLHDLNLELVERHHLLEIPVHIYTRRHASWLALDLNAGPGRPDPDLLALLADASSAQRRMLGRRKQTVGRIATDWGRTPHHFFNLIRLNYLAPDIKLAIIDGRHPPTLTRQALLKAAVPLDWTQQRALFGFAAVAYGQDHVPATGNDHETPAPARRRSSQILGESANLEQREIVVSDPSDKAF